MADEGMGEQEWMKLVEEMDAMVAAEEAAARARGGEGRAGRGSQEKEEEEEGQLERGRPYSHSFYFTSSN